MVNQHSKLSFSSLQFPFSDDRDKMNLPISEGYRLPQEMVSTIHVRQGTKGTGENQDLSETLISAYQD